MLIFSFNERIKSLIYKYTKKLIKINKKKTFKIHIVTFIIETHRKTNNLYIYD